MKRLTVVLGIASLLMLFGVGISQQYGGTLTIATQADAATMDPHNTGDVPSGTIQMHIYESLLGWDSEGNLAPALADSWGWSDDGLTLTMTLKSGVLFQDGTVLTAAVVKYNFDRLLDPTNALRVGPLYNSIDRVDAPNDQTVVFHLNNPDGSLTSGLAAPAASIVSQNALETWGPEIAFRAAGTGPYKLVEWTTNEHLILEAFEDYHGGRPYLDRIVFRPVPDQQARMAMLESGDVDVAFPVPLQDVARLENDDRFDVSNVAGMDNLHMPLNLLAQELTDVRVRQGLNYAIDKEALVRALYLGYARPLTDSPIAPAVFGYSPIGEFYTYDPARAKELLAAAGYADGFNMEILIPDGRYAQDRRVGEAVAAYLSEIGINVQLQPLEWATYVNQILSGSAANPPSYDAVMISYAVGSRDADQGMGNIFRCDQWVPASFNLSFYCNEEVDDWLDRARASSDPEERIAAYGEASKLIMEDAPAIFLVTYDLLGANNANVSGLVLDPMGGILAMNAWRE